MYVLNKHMYLICVWIGRIPVSRHTLFMHTYTYMHYVHTHTYAHTCEPTTYTCTNALFRLLDVHHVEGRFNHELIFYLVFEHMDRDLDQFIKHCPPPGMEEDIIRVCEGMRVGGWEVCEAVREGGRVGVVERIVLGCLQTLALIALGREFISILYVLHAQQVVSAVHTHELNNSKQLSIS